VYLAGVFSFLLNKNPKKEKIYKDKKKKKKNIKKKIIPQIN
jgi:hypothetical protein